MRRRSSKTHPRLGDDGWPRDKQDQVWLLLYYIPDHPGGPRYWYAIRQWVWVPDRVNDSLLSTGVWRKEGDTAYLSPKLHEDGERYFVIDMR
jgi:hypothetical protein